MSRSDDDLTTGTGSAGPAEDAAAYALGALSADEARAFETRLGESPQLRDEVSPLIDTAAALGLAVPPVQPSPGMKESLMARIAVTPQLPALDDAAPSAAEPLPDARGAHLAPVAPLTPGATDSPAQAAPRHAAPASEHTQAPIPMSGLAADRSKARWFSRPGAIVAAAAAAVALFFGGALAADVIRPGGSDVAQQTLAQVVAAPDATVLTSAVEGGASASLISSQELGVSVMVFDGLAELSADEAYALWYITDGEPTPAGLFSVEQDGTVVQVLDGEFVAGTVVGVTVEPASGSPAPTTTPIVAIATA